MVFCINKKSQPINMLNPAEARKLLKEKKAVPILNFPFVIKIKEDAISCPLLEYTLKFDPGAKFTGVAILQGKNVVFLGTIEHKTFKIIEKMEKRANYRRSRRARKTRYRQPRFENRGNKEKGWLPPSVMSKIENIVNWTKKLMQWCNITEIAIEHIKFDTQLIETPEISGVEYQQGTLLGYELREYLLQKFKHKCAYCKKENIPLQIEHIKPKALGGSNRISNLTIACESCNRKKGKLSLQEFGKKMKKDFSEIEKNAKTKTYKDTAMCNASRWKTLEELSNLLPVKCGTGGRTKLNRTIHELPKTHYFDAACVGITPDNLKIKTDKQLIITAAGRGQYRRTNVDKYGFPRQKLPRQKNFFGFYSKSIIEAEVKGQKVKGVISSCRNSGSFTIKTFSGEQITANYRNCKLLQRSNGYGHKLEDIASKIC